MRSFFVACFHVFLVILVPASLQARDGCSSNSSECLAGDTTSLLQSPGLIVQSNLLNVEYHRDCLETDRGGQAPSLNTSTMESEKWWLELPPAPVQNRSHIKLALLLILKDQLDHASIWKEWAEKAKEHDMEVGFYIHPYAAQTSQDFKSVHFQKYVVPDRVNTDWCDIYDAQMLLMQYALKDAQVTHVMIIGEKTFPVKPIQYIYSDLSKQQLSRMCADDAWSPPRADAGWLLRREDAELFANNAVRARDSFRGGCSDEESWYYPLVMRERHWRESAPFSKDCLTYAEWHKCKTVSYMDEHCSCPALHQEERLEVTTPGHPSTFKRAGHLAIMDLLRSPFWFARKFPDGAVDSAIVGWMHDPENIPSVQARRAVVLEVSEHSLL